MPSQRLGIVIAAIVALLVGEGMLPQVNAAAPAAMAASCGATIMPHIGTCPNFIPESGTDTWIYVSPSGSDSNPGTQAQPLKTLAAAQTQVRSLNPNMSGNIIVYLEPGVFQLTSPLTFTPADSGTNGYQVVWTSDPTSPAVISGADRVTGWTLSNRAKNMWSAPVSVRLRTRQIYVDGMRATLASGAVRGTVIETKWGYRMFPDVMAGWKDTSGAEFGYLASMGLWTNVLCPVASAKGYNVRMAQPCWNNSINRANNFVGWGNLPRPAYVENAYELLGKPGQFYLDDKSHTVYYVPRSGQDMTSADVEAPLLQSLLNGAGTAAAPIHDLVFSNLQFSYATWMQPSTPEGFSEIQSNYTITGKHGGTSQGLCHYAARGTCPYGAWTQEPGNVEFTYDRNLSFLNDRFVHLGAAGLALGDGTQNATVEGSVFTDISGSGLEVGNVDMPQATGRSQTVGVTVDNNHLYGIPVEYQGGVPIIVGYAANTLITHNQVDHVPYSGISIGWGGWPDKYGHPAVPNFSHDNTISNNNVFDFMQLLSDGGGIYTQGITGHSFATGEMVTGNTVHDELDWSRALQSDDGATYDTYSGNVLYDNSYDWGSNHIDYTTHGGQFDPQLIEDNYWQQGDPNSDKKKSVERDNIVISGPAQAPASVVSDAGLQSQFAPLLSWQPDGIAVPNAPQRISVLYAFRGQVYLTWRPGFAEGSSPVTSYTVQTCLVNSAANEGGCGHFTNHAVTVTSEEFDHLGYAIVPGLKNGTHYSFQVIETSAAGSSTPSIASDPVAPFRSHPRKPGKPHELKVRAGMDAVIVQWHPPSSARAYYGKYARQPVIAYVVTTSTGQKTTVTSLAQIVLTNGGSRTVYAVTGLTPGKPYRFSVQAVTPAGAGKPVVSPWIRPLPITAAP